MNYGQFCPIAKATEILGERWTILVIRELLMKGSRFSELQRGLGDISPALLTARLRSLEHNGLVERRRIGGQRGHEYFPTKACEALLPAVIALGEWSLEWTRHLLVNDDLDVDFLIFNLGRSVDPDRLVGNHTVIKFRFNDLSLKRDWWLLVDGAKVDLCIDDPGRDVDVYLTTTVRTMHDVWMGDRSYREAELSGDLLIEGEVALTRNVSDWLRPSLFSQSPRGAIPRELAAA
jgi:DNA-binding HxlR family transcriptional regulator